MCSIAVKSVVNREMMLVKLILGCMCTILLLASSSCKKADPITGPTTNLAPVKMGECGAQMINGNNISICFIELLEDSRCPINAVCFWQGVARARFTFKAKGKEASFDLATLNRIPNRQDTVLFGFKIHLVDLLPYPGAPGSGPVAKLQITQ